MGTETDRVDITELRRLLDRASMRNWETHSGSSWEVHSPGLGQRADVVASFPYKGDARAEVDSRLVVAMRNTLPDLLGEIEELRGMNKTLAQQYESMCDHASALLNERDELRRELGY